MKKIILLSTVLFMTCFAAMAQNVKTKPETKITNNLFKQNAIGVRLGWGGEISYQRFLTDDTRLELATGWGYYGFDLAGTYQWLWPLSVDNIGFNWYAGAGAQFGAWNNDYDLRKFGFGILGQIGIEYNLKSAPFVFSIDWRPTLHLTPETRLGWEGFAIGARYRF